MHAGPSRGLQTLAAPLAEPASLHARFPRKSREFFQLNRDADVTQRVSTRGFGLRSEIKALNSGGLGGPASAATCLALEVRAPCVGVVVLAGACISGHNAITRFPHVSSRNV